ncbi:MAG: glycogen synthase GlgA [Anaerolineae bacterium]
MSQQLKIAMIAAEAVPFAKTGGLADVVGALPKTLRQMGHDAIVIMPYYSTIHYNGYSPRLFMGSLGVWMGNYLEWCAVHTTEVDGVPFYFIDSEKYFARDGVYHDSDYNDYLDNPARFGFFTRAALQFLRDTGFKADIVHAHDWQAALAPAYLKIWHWDDPLLGGAASVLTIHNIAHQGVYRPVDYDYLGLGWGNFVPDKFEDHGNINFLKGGIYYADMVNTVSPTYAAETRTPALAHGLAPYLNNKGANYVGILNGVDYDDWNPATDRLIPARYTPDNLGGKAVCKDELQRRFGLAEEPDTPIIGVISRMASQKGLNVLAQTIEPILNDMRVQFILLGSGDKALESYYGTLPSRYPGRAGSFIGFNNGVAHWIEAGCDFFIMPSRFEPCGLNQLYSLKYGTLPIVHATGGLNDTVVQYDEATGDGTGFKFYDVSPNAVYYAVGWAVSTYYDRPQHMAKMIQTAMAQDFSWEQSARQYVAMYEQAMSNKVAV